MSGNRLLTAIAVLAALLALTVWQFNKRDAEDTRAPEVSVKLPKVKKEDVTELSVTAPGKKPVTLKKEGDAWKMTAPIAADADKDAVDTALSKLAELDAVSVAATKAENHERLEVTDAKGVHVVAKQGDKVLADVLIGAYLSGNTMVREAGATNVATAKGSIKYPFDKEVKEWRDRGIVDVTADQVQQIAFQNKNGSWKFVKDAGAGGTWKQAPGEKEIANFDPTKVSGIVTSVASLRANDFAADGVTADAAGVGATPNATVTLTTGGADAGVKEVLLRIGNKQDSNYYAMREGKEPIYLIAEFMGDKLVPTVEKLAKDPPLPPGKTVQVEPSGHKIIPAPGLADAKKTVHAH
jgi:Domain of unknown function (DUF4340)